MVSVSDNAANLIGQSETDIMDKLRGKYEGKIHVSTLKKWSQDGVPPIIEDTLGRDVLAAVYSQGNEFTDFRQTVMNDFAYGDDTVIVYNSILTDLLPEEVSNQLGSLNVAALRIDVDEENTTETEIHVQLSNFADRMNILDWDRGIVAYHSRAIAVTVELFYFDKLHIAGMIPYWVEEDQLIKLVPTLWSWELQGTVLHAVNDRNEIFLRPDLFDEVDPDEVNMSEGESVLAVPRGLISSAELESILNYR